MLDLHELLMWGAVASLVILTTVTGMWVNRFFTHRAHRQALAELRRRALSAEQGLNKGAQYGQ